MEALIALQRSVGNGAARQLVAAGRGSLEVQRVEDPPGGPTGPDAAHVANPAVLADCVGLLQLAYATQSAATSAVLRSWKTVAVGAVVDPDEPGVTKYHWTASGNWNDPGFASAMARPVTPSSG
ncbi:hypothetical protein GCM10009616_28140 [Microlunatus lacustris]